jgi:hypothetical protein
MQGKQDQKTNDSARRIYGAPRLTEYGRVRDLTAGGSGERGESSQANKFKRP